MKTALNNQIKRNRRSIIAMLRTIYPGWAPGEEIYITVLDSQPDYDRRVCVKDMAYLNEKGYVMFKGDSGIDVMNISVQHCLFRLTATGTEVADQLIEDPCLDI